MNILKRVFSVVLAVVMLSVPAFAVNDERYIPVVPEFLTVSSSGVNVNIPIDKNRDDIALFFRISMKIRI